ncbi:ArsR/SmtB family transcription factor [Brevibacillus dissolubilis]|uniref:ArsR/SmtB family transcription factor n=1 Tax=Brevibacillus dissolubilis TaxID=1844116 RepID=UPI001116DE44|nr:metalloregulator ArsR/SmtB family transcription factor [Brevibacillus dissolubilis]
MKNGNEQAHQQALELFRACTPLFQALGDSVRQDIILLLAQHESLNVNQIAEQSPMSRPTISHHLKILREVGLVTVERRATENYYSLQLDHSLDKLRDLMKAVEEC